MKKLIILALAALCFFAAKGKGHAASAASSFPDFMYTGSMTVTSVSASAWTLIPYSTSMFMDRSVVWLEIDPAAAQNVRVAITTSNIAPGTTFYGYQMQPGNTPWMISIDRRMFLWGVAEGAATSVISQEFK